MWRDWSEEPDKDAVQLACATIAFARSGRWRSASRALAELSEVVWTQCPGIEPVVKACAEMLNELRRVAAKPNLVMRAACVMERLYGRDEEYLKGTEYVLELGTDRSGMPAGDPWVDEAALYRVRVLGRLGRLPEAVEAALGLLEVVSGDASGELTWIEFEAGYERCRDIHAQEIWTEVLDACHQFKERWIKEPGLPVRQREMLSGVMWIEAWSSMQVSEGWSGFAGGAASQLLDELLAWLRQQPEPALQLVLGRRLAARFRWPADFDGMVDVLDELTQLLDTVDDRSLTMESAEVVLENIRRLLMLDPTDRHRLQGTLVEFMRDEQALRSPGELGVSDALVERMERTASSLGRLDARLSDYSDDESGALRAGILIYEMMAAGVLGRTEEAERLTGVLLKSGATAIAACDRIISEVHNVEAQGHKADLEGLLGTLQLRAAIAADRGDALAAVADYREIIDRFSERSEPAVQHVVELAHQRLAELSEMA